MLLHIALAAAPTSSIYYKPPPHRSHAPPQRAGDVINAIPFSAGPTAPNMWRSFAARINPAFYPQPQGARDHDHGREQIIPAAFDMFRAIQKRTGKNFAALSGDYHAALWASIRAGWRSPYTIALDYSPDSAPAAYSRYAIALTPDLDGVEQTCRQTQRLRQARAAARITRAFDLELVAATPMTPESLRATLELLRDRATLPNWSAPDRSPRTTLTKWPPSRNSSRSPQLSLPWRTRRHRARRRQSHSRKAQLPRPQRRRGGIRRRGPPVKRLFTLALTLVLFVAAQPVSLINSVRALIAAHDLAGAERQARAYQARTPASPELAAALSWLARATLVDAKNPDRADALAAEANKMASRFLIGQKLDDDPWLPTAVGASIEIHAQVLAARGERPEAIAYLQGQLKQYAGTSLPERIRKNINLLSLEGKPAPPLDLAQWHWAPRPPTLASLRGRPVLLFFWAHWCSDCKAEVAIVADMQRTFGPKGWP